ncbi:MAG: Holliday junction resolvase RuvX [Candidatus Moranbacteria bacterium]|nr:Holliday junction resolvase RuvX [Candidatus Moranbacteria bacterium]
MGNYLGIDYGERKVGVALGHAETRLAMAYGVFQNDEKLLDNIGIVLEKEEIGTVVIGVHKSITFQGEHEGEKLGKLVGERFSVAVAYQDEMFTSKMAQSNLIAQGQKNVSAHDDAEAASILLQSWLDHKNLP